MPTPVNSAGHTPGPWIADGLVIVTKGVKSIGFIYGPSFPERSDLGRRALADAGLAAAAPDLLEALRRAVAIIDDLNSAYGSAAIDEIAEAGRAAICRATGETQ